MDAAEARLAAFKADAASVRLGGGGGIGGGGGADGGGEGSLIGAATLLGGAALPGLAGAGMGLGLLAGTGALAFGGVAQALSSAHQASQNTGTTPQQTAAQNFANQVQLSQAQQSVTSARQQAAQNAVTSSASVEQADMNLAETERNTAASRVQALEQVQQAQQSVASATYNLSQANYQLNQAYEQAREQLAQYNDQLADAKLSVTQAQLAVQQAELQQREVNQNAYTTDLDRQQAALAVAQAKQQVTDATDRESNAQYAANQANAAGVNGSQTVIAAKQAQQSAQQGLTSAQQAYADAQTSLTNTELDNATQLREAQMQAASAREQAAYQQRQDAQAVAAAEKNVTDTIREQQLQIAAAASTSNSAASQFAAQMAKLTPAGRAFVDQVLGLRGAFSGLEAAAENAVLPGVSTWLHGIADLAPEVKSAVSGIGGALGQMAGQIGRQLDSPEAANVLAGLVRNGEEFITTVLPPFGRFFAQLLLLGSRNGAVTGLADALAGIGDGLSSLVSGLTPYIPDFDQIFEVVAKVAKILGPSLANDIGAVASAFSPIAAFLNSPLGAPFLTAFSQVTAALLSVKGLAKLLPGQLGEYFGAIPGKVAELVIGPVKGMLPGLEGGFGAAFESMSGSALTFVTGLGARLGEATARTWAWLAQNTVAAGAYIAENMAEAASATAAFIAENLATLGLVAVIGLVIAGIVLLATHWKTAWHDIETVALAAYHDAIEPALHGIAEAGLWLWHDVFEPVWRGIEAGWTREAAFFRKVWSDIKQAFTDPVNFLISTVYDKGIARFWNDVVGAVGLSALKLPVIPALAGGGIIPGTDHGRDEVMIAARPQEGVLVPGAVRAIGGPRAVYALNAVHGGKGSADGRSYAGGGIVGTIGSLLSGGLDVAKAVTALATGNTEAFTNALAPLMGTSAAGSLGQVMLGLPRTAVTDAAKKVESLLGGGSGQVGAGQVTSQVAAWYAAAVKAAGVPATWIPGLEQIGSHESGFNAQAVNRTAAGVAAGLPEGVMQTIMPTFLAYHAAGTSSNIFDPVANIAAAARYIQAEYGDPANTPGLRAVAQGQPYSGYDSGGWLPPGMTAAVNLTGKPEAVLTPAQSAALQQLATGGGARPPAQVTVNFYGTQLPSAEQMAEIERRLSLAVG